MAPPGPGQDAVGGIGGRRRHRHVRRRDLRTRAGRIEAERARARRRHRSAHQGDGPAGIRLRAVGVGAGRRDRHRYAVIQGGRDRRSGPRRLKTQRLRAGGLVLPPLIVVWPPEALWYSHGALTTPLVEIATLVKVVAPAISVRTACASRPDVVIDPPPIVIMIGVGGGDADAVVAGHGDRGIGESDRSAARVAREALIGDVGRGELMHNLR